MNKPLVSIILPIYNTCDILKNTFLSIVSQSYDNIELIMIDDGSELKTAKLVDQLALTDDRVKVIHKKNEGTCCARNLGLKIAKGDYITFCDHDDEFDKDLILSEILAAIKNNYDMVVVGKKYIYEDKKEKNYSFNHESQNHRDSQILFYKLISNQTASTVWNILYKRSVINGVYFDEKMKKGQEDIAFNLQVADRIQSIKSIDKCLYYHYIRNNMSTSASLHYETLIDMQSNICVLANKLNSNLNIDSNSIAQFQGELLRIYVTYAIKLGVDLDEFKKLNNNLNIYKIKIHIYQIKNKEILIYYLVNKNRISTIYFILKLYYLINCFRNG